MHGAGRTSRPPGRLGSAVDGGADITQQCAMALGFSTTSLRTNVGNAASVCDRQHVPPSSLTFSWRTTPRTHPCSFHHSDTSQPTSTAAILPLRAAAGCPRARWGAVGASAHLALEAAPGAGAVGLGKLSAVAPTAQWLGAAVDRRRRLRLPQQRGRGLASAALPRPHACTCWARGDTILIL